MDINRINKSQKKRYKVAITTPYPAPNLTTFYENMARHPQLDITVYYYSPYVLERYTELGIKNEDWGIELLGDFSHKFLKNLPIKIGRNGQGNPFRFINPQIIGEIRKNRYDALILGTWSDVTSNLAILSARLFGTPIMLLSDSNHAAEAEKPAYIKLMKQLFLGKYVFPATSACLYPGTVTRLFYKLYGVSEDKLFRFPYSIDTDTFSKSYRSLKAQKNHIRAELGLAEDALVILFVGRLHHEDLPFDLLKAYQQVKADKKALVYVGEGPLKSDLAAYVQERDLKQVYFPGFQNRKKLPHFYAAADLFVHPAAFEPWGMTVHEAMCFGLPVIATDKVGSAVDLVMHNQNGFIYPCGDIDRLADYMEELASDIAKRQKFSHMSLEIIKDWGPEMAGNDLVCALDYIYCGHEQVKKGLRLS